MIQRQDNYFATVSARAKRISQGAQVLVKNGGGIGAVVGNEVFDIGPACVARSAKAYFNSIDARRRNFTLTQKRSPVGCAYIGATAAYRLTIINKIAIRQDAQ
jgi:hypothetical protein